MLVRWCRDAAPRDPGRDSTPLIATAMLLVGEILTLMPSPVEKG